MTVNEDAEKLMHHANDIGLEFDATLRRGEDHVGALLTNLVLQRRQKYKEVVEPRVEAVRNISGADTLTGFHAVVIEQGATNVLRFSSEDRGTQLVETIAALKDFDIETVADLRDVLSGERRNDFRDRLLSVKNVGLKTVNYLDILAGIDGRAVDIRVKRFARAAGIENWNDADYLTGVLDDAARLAGVPVGSIDAAIWAADVKD